MPGKHTGKAVPRTLQEYSSVTTIHGLYYIFAKNIPTTDRILWFILVSISVFLVAMLSCQAYQHWMENPVITTLEDTSRSNRNMKYPAITICSEGLDMLAVDRALQKEFKTWKEKSARPRRSVLYEDEKEQFLKEKFQIMSKDQNIFKIVKSFFVENIDHFIKQDGVRENLLACRKQENQEGSKRRKRSTAACIGDTLAPPNTCSTNSYQGSQSCDCGSFGKVSKMLSSFSSSYDDRRWSIVCQNIPQYEQRNSGYKTGARLSSWEISPYLNNAFVSGITSSFSRGDRTYRIKWSRNNQFTIRSDFKNYNGQIKKRKLRPTSFYGLAPKPFELGILVAGLVFKISNFCLNNQAYY